MDRHPPTREGVQQQGAIRPVQDDQGSAVCSIGPGSWYLALLEVWQEDKVITHPSLFNQPFIPQHILTHP